METVKNIIEYFSLFMSAVMLVLITNKTLQIFQQSHYQYRSFQKSIKHYYLKDPSNFWPPYVFFFFYLHLWYIQLIFGIYLGVFIYFKIRRKSILKLKYTARIKRIFFLLIIVNTLIASILSWKVDLPHLGSAVAFLLLFTPFVVYFTALLIQPLESLISYIYRLKAKRKLAKIEPIVIGITGSYGKTGTKNILFSYLKDRYMVLPSPASYNTLNGLALTINRKLKKHHQVFIAEMGATGMKDIEKLVKFIRPKYGIITAIGPQHLETFKSIDNILTEKTKLLKGLPETGIAVVNFDNEYLKTYAYNLKCRLVTFGLSEGVEYQARDVKADLSGISFKIKYKNKEISLRTPLLGSHNLYNVLAAFALATELGIPESELIYQTSVLEPVENRLHLRKEGNLVILDDAFNSNPEGFNNALDVLSEFPKYRILITPGIVEGGKEETAINFKLAEKISAVCDLVILIKTRASLSIKKGLEVYSYQNVKVVEDFQKAIKFVKENYPDAAVLIENDITDIYKI